jgi:hypothetical protein
MGVQGGMTVFHFNVRAASVLFVDTRGIDFATIDEAVTHGERDARHMMWDEPALDPNRHWIEIANDRGNVIRTVPFGHVANQ